MMFRLLALLMLPVLAYFLVKSLQDRFNFSPRQSRVLFLIVAFLLVIGVLVLLGRLPIGAIFAPLGAAFAFVLRFLPTILRILPMWQLFKGSSASAKQRSDGQTSTIRTQYFLMELDHDTGNMDGSVLIGSFSQHRLSDLSLKELLNILNECQDEADSAQVLVAYLDRNYPEWGDYSKMDSYENLGSDTQMDQRLALEILGLQEPITQADVIKAHRQLMQKLHPDRGGSDYLAKKINLAKDFLTGEFD